MQGVAKIPAILNLKRKRGWEGSCEDDGSRDSAVKPPWMGLRRSSKGPPQPQNQAKNIKLGIAAKIPTVYKKIFVGLMLIIVIVMPEDVVERLLDLLHLGYEGISFVLEELIQHVLDVDKYLSQSIVFYLWLSMALFGLYYLGCSLPSLCRRLKHDLFAVCSQYRSDLVDYWSGLTLFRKVRFVALFAVGLYLFFSVFT